MSFLCPSKSVSFLGPSKQVSGPVSYLPIMHRHELLLLHGGESLESIVVCWCVRVCVSVFVCAYVGVWVSVLVWCVCRLCVCGSVLVCVCRLCVWVCWLSVCAGVWVCRCVCIRCSTGTFINFKPAMSVLMNYWYLSQVQVPCSNVFLPYDTEIIRLGGKTIFNKVPL